MVTGKQASVSIAALVVSLMMASAADAQTSQTEVHLSAIDFDVPAGPLDETLVRIAKASGYTITIDPRLAAAKRSRAIRGTYTADQAFSMALAGSNLHLEQNGSGGFTVAPGAVVDTSGAEGRVLATVRIAGAQEPGSTFIGTGGTVVMPTQGANGSYDTLATEGTESYAPIGTQLATGAPSSIHDTPFSVSAVTRQRIEDGRLETLDDAVAALPGIFTAPLSGGTQDAVSRGFHINNYQVDGNAPLITSQGNGVNYQPQFDLSQFDNVSIIRGGDALASAFGDPGGTINLQRKRPVAGAQLLAEANVGSFQKYRGSLDFSSPITKDDKLKIRSVYTHDQQHYFYDRAHSARDMLYANLEYDPSSKTSFNLGGSSTWEHGLDNRNGLPLYTDGTTVNFPRDTCLCFDNDHYFRNTIEGFAEARHEFSSAWRFRANFDYQKSISEFNATVLIAPVGLFKGGSNPIYGPNIIQLSGSYGRSESYGITGGAELDGGLKVLGRMQTFTVGYSLNRQKILSSTGGTYVLPKYADLEDPTSRFDIFNFDPTAGDGQPFDVNADNGFLSGRVRQSSVYAQVRLNPIKHLWLTISDRYQWYRYEYASVYSVDALRVSKFQKPAYTARYDITKNLNVYGSLSYIDTSVINVNLDANLKPLPPERGDNLEGGVKYQTGNGRFNGSLAVFRTRRSNTPTFDPVSSALLGYPLNCCFVAGYNTESAGLDVELNGSLTRNWQVAGGYTWQFEQKIKPTVDTTIYTDIPGIGNLYPKHLLKLSTSYRLTGWGVPKLTIGGDLHYQSKGIVATSLYNVGDGDILFFAGQAIGLNRYNARLRAPGYATINVFMRYQISSRLKLQLNVTNLLDKKYYAGVTGVQSGNFYGDPRTIQATLFAKF